MSNSTILNFATTNSSLPLPFPEGDLYVDANSWVDIAANRLYGQVTQDYLVSYITQEGTPLILWSPHITHEFLECLTVDEYAKEAKKRGIRGNRAFKQLENTISVQDAKIINESALHRYDQVFSVFKDSVYEIDDIDILPTVREIMKIYGVPFKDAKHLAYMWHEETNNLLTNDKRFALVPGLNVFSASIQSNNNTIIPFSKFMPDLPLKLKT